MRSKRFNPDEIPAKANHLLHLSFIALCIILLRIWQLSFLEHEERVEEVKKPMHKVVLEPAKRGTIRDRFNIPLAINAINYQAAVVWGSITEVPSVSWDIDAKGNKVKRLLRREYIEKLSELLAKELNMKAEIIEDLIWSTATFYGQAPFVIKEGLSEEQYYRLNMLSRLWPGIQVLKKSVRRYPEGPVGGDILGYMGAINREEYQRTIGEIQVLHEFIEAYHVGEEIPFPLGIYSVEQAKQKLTTLQEKAYTIFDFVGKSGIEKTFEKELRGAHGRQEYESDARGNFLRELPGSKESSSGQRLLLTISKELQEYAEELLAFEEKVRDDRQLHAKLDQKAVSEMTAPWIKGGAIVAIEPNTGEVLALASYPRFDPNDFIPHNQLIEEKKRIQHVHQWLETEKYIGWIWDQKLPLNREFYDVLINEWITEEKWLTWDNFLQLVYQKKSAPYLALRSVKNIKQALDYLEGRKSFEGLSLDEQLLCLDLLRLLVCETRFDPELTSAVGHLSLDRYRELSASAISLKEVVKQKTMSLFHDTRFKAWREENTKPFLRTKRAYEREHNLWAKPYIEYFNREEKAQFDAFWEEWGHHLTHTFATKTVPENVSEEVVDFFTHLLDEEKEFTELFATIQKLPGDQVNPFLASFRSFDELDRPALGKWRQLRKPKGEQTEKEIAMSFYPRWGFGYGRSYGYRQSSIQGSIFKLVTAYSGLKHKFEELQGTKGIITRSDLNTYEIHDQVKQQGGKWELGKFADGTSIPQVYKGGRLPRSMNYNLGKVDLVKAIEVSSNPYFSLIASEWLPSTEYYTDVIKSLSFGEKTGIELTGEIGGKIPTDLENNKTGLYATAIGQHTLVVTPLQTATMLATLANGGKVFCPKVALKGIRKEDQLQVFEYPSKIKNEVLMPNPCQELIFNGMKRVLSHSKPEHLYRYYPGYKEWLKEYSSIHKDLLGKTSTSEAIEYQNLGTGDRPFQVCHAWFGGICFEQTPLDQNRDLLIAKDPYGKPELVVVVYLRFGRLGKETMPVAAMMAKKWREIKTKMLPN